MDFILAVILAFVAVVVGHRASSTLPVGGDGGFGTLLVAAVLGLLAGLFVAYSEMQQGTPWATSLGRGLGMSAMTFLLALIVVLFVLFAGAPV